MSLLPFPPLLLITDRKQARQPLPELVAAVLAAGCRWVSLREKDLTPEARADLVRALLPAVRRHGALLTVHGDLEAARLCDGVHQPGGGDVAAARAVLGPDALVGLSCHDPAEITGSGADYATLSPIFPSRSKPGYGPVLGPQALRAAAGQVPVLALGGVEPGNAAACRKAGASGLAVMGGIMAATDPAAAWQALAAAWLRPDP